MLYNSYMEHKRGFVGYVLLLMAIAFGIWYAGQAFYSESLSESNVTDKSWTIDKKTPW